MTCHPNSYSATGTPDRTTTERENAPRPWRRWYLFLPLCLCLSALLILVQCVRTPSTLVHSSSITAGNAPPSTIWAQHDGQPAQSQPTQPHETTTTPRTLQQQQFAYSNVAKIIPDVEHAEIDEATRAKITTQWGKWGFWDGDEAIRPSQEDYCAAYPNRDIPGNRFPANAWQTDAVFVNHLLDAGEQLVYRTMEAIFTEYGWGKDQHPPEQLATITRERRKMYEWIMVDFTEEQPPSPFQKRQSNGIGGYTSERSMNGLVRRLLHAMMTNDQFVVVLGGHSAAAGHGNHFRQSYAMQFHRVMAPVLARLGVKLITRNMSQGGLGTIQNAMGMQSLYGDDIDLLLWDCGMTEGSDVDIEYFLRMGILSGKKVPVLWGGTWNTLQFLHQFVDADVGFFGRGTDGVPVTVDEEQALTIPYAARYMKCDNKRLDLCTKQDRFCAVCWIPRDDLDPANLFPHLAPKPGSQVRWHPGWRPHQLYGRVLALSVLEALQIAINQWSEGTMSGPPLDDSFWHVTEYYDNIRNKLKNLEDDKGYCKDLTQRGFPLRGCKIAMQARSLFTPRANPHETSLINLIKGPKPEPALKALYDGPDVHNTCFDVPEGEVDVWAVASNRRHRSLSGKTVKPVENLTHDTTSSDAWQSYSSRTTRSLGEEALVQGSGWQHVGEYPGDCDGRYDTFCGRHSSNSCPLIGHHDSRGMLVGDELSGRIVFEIPEVKEGLIIFKVITWLTPPTDEADGKTGRMLTATNASLSWDDIMNNDYEDNHLDASRRMRRLTLDKFPDTFAFDYSVDGKETTLNKSELAEQIKSMQRVVELLVVLDDPNFGHKENVQVSFQMRGCGKQCVFAFTHAYWA